MSLKPVLVKIDEDIWKHAKIRASVLGVTSSQFVEQALGHEIAATTKQEAQVLTRSALYTSNYVSSMTTGLAHTPSNRRKR